MKRYAYLDIEATHTNWVDSEIIEIAFIIQDETGKDLDFFQSLIKPQKPVDENITELTGITNKMATTAPEFHEVAQKISDKLRDCIIVAHKAEFDYELLKKMFQRLGTPFRSKSVCTLKMSQNLIPELKSYSLQSLCDFLQISLRKKHRAYDDALALSKLHQYLRLINGEINEEKKFFPKHLKLIQNSPIRPGVIIIHYFDKKEVIKTDNIQKRLSELLSLQSSNRVRVTTAQEIELRVTSSLIQAGLIQSRLEKTFYPFCLYQLKNKKGKLILRVGKTDIRRKALYYTRTKKEAIEILGNIIETTNKTRYAYQDTDDLKSEIVKENIQLVQKIRRLTPLEKNYLVRSAFKDNGKFQYTLIRGARSFATFETELIIKTTKDLRKILLKYRPISPREYMSFNDSLRWIKNQKRKTDFIQEVGKIV